MTGATNGSIDWRTAPAQKITGDFTVETTSGGFSFAFEPGTLAGWTGHFDDSGGILLVIPASNGGFRDVAMRPASSRDFETAAAALR